MSKEQGTVDDDDLDIEIIDDTPDEDRDKPVATGDEPEGDVSEEELASYSDSVRKRIGQITAARHAERRRAEAAERQLRAVTDYTNALKAQASSEATRGAAVAAEGFEARKLAAQRELELAQAEHSKAFEDGDAGLVGKATARLSRAAADLGAVENEEKRLRALASRPRQPQPAPQHQQPQVPRPSNRAMAWNERNPWFGKDKVRTATAFGIHETLVKDENFDPESDDYYNELDKRMAAIYPDKSTSSSAPSSPTRRLSSGPPVVAPASRQAAGTASRTPRKVQLTASQREAARNLGVSEQQYAKEVLRLQER